MSDDILATVKKALDSGASLDAYYYSFTATGLGVIDKILSAVACAGKAYHHTDGWLDETPSVWTPKHLGATPVDWIQNAANEATETLRALVAEVERLEFCRTKEHEAFLIVSDDLRTAKSALAALCTRHAAAVEHLRGMVGAYRVACQIDPNETEDHEGHPLDPDYLEARAWLASEAKKGLGAWARREP